MLSPLQSQAREINPRIRIYTPTAHKNNQKFSAAISPSNYIHDLGPGLAALVALGAGAAAPGAPSGTRFPAPVSV